MRTGSKRRQQRPQSPFSKRHDAHGWMNAAGPGEAGSQATDALILGDCFVLPDEISINNLKYDEYLRK